jgi:hypothetical protein
VLQYLLILSTVYLQYYSVVIIYTVVQCWRTIHFGLDPDPCRIYQRIFQLQSEPIFEWKIGFK